MRRALFCFLVLMAASPAAALTVIAEPAAMLVEPVVVPVEEQSGLSATETMVMLLGSVVFSVVLLGRKLD